MFSVMKVHRLHLTELSICLNQREVLPHRFLVFSASYCNTDTTNFRKVKGYQTHNPYRTVASPQTFQARRVEYLDRGNLLGLGSSIDYTCVMAIQR